MNKHKSRNILIGVLLLSLVVGVVIWSKLPFDAGNADVEPVARGKNVPHPNARLPEGERAADKSEVLRILLSARDDRWLVGARELSLLPLNEQWLVLTSPGVANQLAAKAMQEDILNACAVSLSKPAELHAADDARNSLLDQSCSELKKVGGADSFYAIARGLAGDTDYQTADFRLWRFDKESMSASQIEEKVQELEQAIADASSPAEVKGAVQALWLGGSVAYKEHWGDVEKLSRFQQSRLESALVADTTASITGGGGSRDSTTLIFCASIPGVSCERGQGLDAILRQNLSQDEYMLLKQLTARNLNSN